MISLQKPYSVFSVTIFVTDIISLLLFIFTVLFLLWLTLWGIWNELFVFNWSYTHAQYFYFTMIILK